MASGRHITLKLFSFLVLTDVLETFAQFCFKKSVAASGIIKVGNLQEGLLFVGTVLPSPFLWAALLSVLAIFIAWSAILSKIDLSVAVPVCSFSYIGVPLVSSIFLHEQISSVRWTGIFFILMGVILVSLSSRHPAKRT